MDAQTYRDRTLELPPEPPAAAAVWLRFEPAIPAAGDPPAPYPDGPGPRLSLPRAPAGAVLDPGQEIVLGSGSAADVRFLDPTVSGRHCRVAHAGDRILVTDLASRNGVRVGGVRVGTASMTIGAGFEVGRTVVWIEPGSRDEGDGAAPLSSLVGASPPMRRLAAAVRRIAPLRLPALLRGESGTGKDLVARAIHLESPRGRRPFVAINAATVSRDLAESELFGHKKGAFTGAMRDRRGAFREAHEGTLFLDEIAALSLEVQAKLLRVVEDGSVRPLGAEASVPLDVRLLVATCEPLEAMVRDGRFRGDLYERLAVCVVRVPPLRERASDVAALARHLLATSEIGARVLTPGAIALLRAQRWPGNVRELRNVVVQAALRSGPQVQPDDVAAILAERSAAGRPRLCPTEALRIFEEVGRNVSAAARRAELPRSTMRDLLRAAARRMPEDEG